MMQINNKTILAIAFTVVISTVIGYFVERWLQKRWPKP